MTSTLGVPFLSSRCNRKEVVESLDSCLPLIFRLQLHVSERAGTKLFSATALGKRKSHVVFTPSFLVRGI